MHPIQAAHAFNGTDNNRGGWLERRQLCCDQD